MQDILCLSSSRRGTISSNSFLLCGRSCWFLRVFTGKTVSISIVTITTAAAAAATSSVCQSVERLTEEQKTGLCLAEEGEEEVQRPTQDEDLHPSVSELPGLDLQLVVRAAVRNQKQHFGKVWSAARGLAERGPEDQV